MKYTILGFNQAKVMRIDGIDMSDLVILKWIMDLSSRASSIKKEFDGTTMVWVKYDTLIEDLPILGLKKRGLETRLSKLVELGLLVHHHDKNNGSYSYYAGTDMLEDLMYPREESEGGMHQNAEGYAPECRGGMQNFAEGGMHENADHILITKDTYNNNTYNKRNLEKGLDDSMDLPKTANTIDKPKSKLEREREKLALPFQSDEFKEMWAKLCLLPKWRIKTASQLQFSLNKLANMTEQDAIRSIEQTMECGYQGIFPPKPQSAYGSTPPPVAPTPSPEPPKRKKKTPWEEFDIPEDEWKMKHPHYSDYD